MINGSDYSLIIFGIIGATLFFTLQLLLCIKAKKTAVKLIPVFLILLCALFVAAIYMGMFGRGGGFIAANEILALLLALILGIALVGDVLAWVVYVIHKKTQKS